MDQQQVWDALAEPWNKYRQQPLKEVESFLKDKSGKILDLGCGSGRNLIQNQDIEYYGADFSKKMLQFAQKKATSKKIRARFFNIDLSNLPFEEEFFDGAIFISTLHCIEGEEVRRRVLEELFRVLKEGSEALITVWDKESNKNLQNLKQKQGFINWNKDDKIHKRYYYLYEKAELKELLEEIGFKIKDITTTKADTKHSKKNIIFYVLK